MSVLLSKMCLGQIQNLKNTQSTEIKKKTFVSKNHTKTCGKKLHKNTIGALHDGIIHPLTKNQYKVCWMGSYTSIQTDIYTHMQTEPYIFRQLQIYVHMKVFSSK